MSEKEDTSFLFCYSNSNDIRVSSKESFKLFLDILEKEIEKAGEFEGKAKDGHFDRRYFALFSSKYGNINVYNKYDFEIFKRYLDLLKADYEIKEFDVIIKEKYNGGK